MLECAGGESLGLAGSTPQPRYKKKAKQVFATETAFCLHLLYHVLCCALCLLLVTHSVTSLLAHTFDVKSTSLDTQCESVFALPAAQMAASSY